MLRRLGCDYAALRLAMPHRSYRGLRARAMRLGLTKSRHRWTVTDIRKLERLWKCGASEDVISRAFPHSGWTAIAGQASYNGFGRRPRELRRLSQSALDGVRDHARALDYTLVQLDRLIARRGSIRRYFGASARHVDIAKLKAAAEILGGELYIEWEPLD